MPMLVVFTEVTFSCNFWYPIGTCLFRIQISDAELLILKGELQLYRNHNFYAEVATHIVNASFCPSPGLRQD